MERNIVQFYTLALGVLLLIAEPTEPYSMEAPDNACGAMFPGHQFDAQDNARIPITFTVSPEGPIAPGQSVTIELKITEEGQNFKGYMVQARRFASESEKNSVEDLDAFEKRLKTPLGHFETEESSYLTCGPGIHNTITHRNQKEKRVVSAKWIAPQDYEGELYFRYTVVIDYGTYYVGVETPRIRMSREAAAPTINSTTTTTTTTTTTPTTTTSADDTTYFPIKTEESNAKKNATVGVDDSGEGLEGFGEKDVNLTEKSTTSTTTTTTSTTTTTTTITTTTTMKTTTTTEKPKIIEAEHEMLKGCGSTKSCFGMPVGCVQDGNCNVVVSYELNGDQMLFKLLGFPYHDNLPEGSEGYLSFGLSPTDTYMGDDLTTACYFDQETSKVKYQNGFNTKTKQNKKLDDQKSYMNNFEGAYKDGLLSCQFKRPEKVQIKHKDTVMNINLFDDQFAILLARGRVRSGERLEIHYEKVATSKPISLGLSENLVAKSKIFYRLHGAFMVAAWIFTASLGTILARYFKKTWTHMKCLGKDVWFPCHVSLMSLTWILTMVAFILVFVELNLEWTTIPINENPHALLGCITTGLCFIQPLMALFRPSPNGKYRPLFNWTHWFVGNSAQIVAFAAIFFAVELQKAELPPETTYLLIAYVIFHALVHLLLTITKCVSDRKTVDKKDLQDSNQNLNVGKNGRVIPTSVHHQHHHGGFYNNGYNGHSGYNNGHHHNGYYKTHSSNGYPVRQPGYPVMPPQEPYPDYEELGKGDGACAVPRKALIALYFLVVSIATAMLIGLVVLAPARKALADAGILPLEVPGSLFGSLF